MAHDPKGLRWGVLGTAAIARVVIAANPRRFRAVAGRAPRRTTSFAASTGLERNGVLEHLTAATRPSTGPAETDADAYHLEFNTFEFTATLPHPSPPPTR